MVLLFLDLQQYLHGSSPLHVTHLLGPLLSLVFRLHLRPLLGWLHLSPTTDCWTPPSTALGSPLPPNYIYVLSYLIQSPGLTCDLYTALSLRPRLVDPTAYPTSPLGCLMNILKSTWLKHPPHFPTNPLPPTPSPGLSSARAGKWHQNPACCITKNLTGFCPCFL